MELIVFVTVMTLLGVAGIAIGLAVGRAVANRAARRERSGDDAFMTPVGPPPDEGAEAAAAADATDPASAAGTRGESDGNG